MCVCLCGHEERSVLGVFYSPCQTQDSPKCFYQASSPFLLPVTALRGKVYTSMCVCQKGNVQQVGGGRNTVSDVLSFVFVLLMFPLQSCSGPDLRGGKQATQTSPEHQDRQPLAHSFTPGFKANLMWWPNCGITTSGPHSVFV